MSNDAWQLQQKLMTAEELTEERMAAFNGEPVKRTRLRDAEIRIFGHIAALEAENNRLRKGMDDVLLTHAAFQSEAGGAMCMCEGCDALRAIVEGQQL